MGVYSQYRRLEDLNPIDYCMGKCFRIVCSIEHGWPVFKEENRVC